MKVLPVAALCLSVVALSGCSSPAPPARPLRTPAVSFSATACPALLGRAADVQPVATRGALVPPDAHPAGALICEYGSVFDQGSGPDHSLKKQVVLGPARATQLAGAAAKVGTGASTGSASCPDDVGTVTVIAFDTTPVADLWWETSGCQSIDSGAVEAEQVANPSFAAFQQVFARITR